MKYLITQEQVTRLQELAGAFELVSIQGLIDELKPIEPLSDKEIFGVYYNEIMYSLRESEKTLALTFARGIEKHILGDKT